MAGASSRTLKARAVTCPDATTPLKRHAWVSSLLEARPDALPMPDLQLGTGSGPHQSRFDHVAVWALTRMLVEFDIAQKALFVSI